MGKKFRTSCLLLLVVVLLAGCDVNINIGTGEATPTSPPSEPTATLPPPTATPQPAAPTATSEPTEPSEPAPSPEPEPERIRFDPGATSATVTGRVAADSADVYVLRALAGQTMDVEVLTPSSSVRLEIWGEDGTVLKHQAVNGPSWVGVLPATQDYFVQVISAGAAVDYTLRVTIPPLEPEPERIEFEPGAIPATRTGHVAANGAALYVLRAMGGQTMEVDLVSAADLHLEIWGEDGTPLKRAAVGGPSWMGTLPSTQDYFVKAVSFGPVADYTLTVAVLPLESERPATRIEFEPGATSATVTGHVGAHQADLYVLRALEGQTMEVVLDSPAEDVLLEIWGEDGIPLKRHVDGETEWTGELPATQDYFVHVVSFGSAADYALTVTIPPP